MGLYTLKKGDEMFNNAKRIKELEGQVIKLTRDLVKQSENIDRAANTEKALRSELNRANDLHEKASKKVGELRELVRAQTDADLLINAFKATGIIREEAKTDHKAEEERLMLLRQQAGLAAGQAVRPIQSRQGPGFSALSDYSIFGRFL